MPTTSSRRLLGAAAVALALLAFPAAARDLTQAETAAVAERVQAFDAAIRASDFPAVIGFVPPKVFETIAADNGIDAVKLRDVVAQQMELVFRDATLEAFEIDLDGAERRQLPDGTPYLLMRTTTVVRIPGDTRVETKNSTLALAEGEVWYLVRLDDPGQVDVLRRAYPAFANETFPLGTSRQLP